MVAKTYVNVNAVVALIVPLTVTVLVPVGPWAVRPSSLAKTAAR
jgi:hypothetical protein